jgi:hypothetical protein
MVTHELWFKRIDLICRWLTLFKSQQKVNFHDVVIVNKSWFLKHYYQVGKNNNDLHLIVILWSHGIWFDLLFSKIFLIVLDGPYQFSNPDWSFSIVISLQKLIQCWKRVFTLSNDSFPNEIFAYLKNQISHILTSG